MEKYFVDILPVYDSEQSRTIEKLSKLYDNQDFLQKSISDLISKHFEPEMISDKCILLKPNWVKHSVNETDEICLRTNDNFLLATLEIVLKYKPASVLIGDAPIQGCKWNGVVTSILLSEIQSLSKKHNIPVEIKDFRRVTFTPSKNNPNKEQKPLTDYLIFDLGKNSALEPITRSDKSNFRVTNYNPDRLSDSHKQGTHKYCITKNLFDVDLIISIPKIKTHQKTGITAALKNLVGINGDKDFLPHHRMGGVGFGGDCYPGKNILRLFSEQLLDFANRRQGKPLYWFGWRLSGILWQLSFPKKEHDLAAAWHGNDTTWRMVLDLNKIAIYGKSDGTLSNEPQRQLFSLCDGIIGGQGDGPLKPEPLPLGIISLTNHSGMNDNAMGTLMGLDIDRISLLKNSISGIQKGSINIFWKDQLTNLDALEQFSIPAKLPPGWINYRNSI